MTNNDERRDQKTYDKPRKPERQKRQNTDKRIQLVYGAFIFHALNSEHVNVKPHGFIIVKKQYKK